MDNKYINTLFIISPLDPVFTPVFIPKLYPRDNPVSPVDPNIPNTLSDPDVPITDFEVLFVFTIVGIYFVMLKLLISLSDIYFPFINYTYLYIQYLL